MPCNRIVVAFGAALLVFSTHAVSADVRADQKTRVELGGMLGRMANLFGGKAAKEGVVSTVAVKSNRKATMNEQTGQIVDLTEEKVYDLDLKKKSYKVTTFAELRRRMEEAQKKAEEDARKQEGRESPAPPSNEKQEMEVDVDIRNTGEQKAINGFDTRQVIMTITLREKGKTLAQGGGMVATTDMWLAPKIAAMKEIADFDVRYAQQLYGGMFAGVSAEQMAAAMALYPMMKQAMGRMTIEGAKLEGTAILTTMTMDAVKSGEQIAQETTAAEEKVEKPAPSLGGLLGGLAKKAAARKGDDGSKARTTFMTSTNEVLAIATAVSAGDVDVPAGFKENK
jgi:hypothetical protein